MSSTLKKALKIERDYLDLCELLGDLPVSPAQALIIMKIDGSTPLRRCGEGSNLTYRVAALVEAGLVVRIADRRDMRAALLSLTLEGEAVKADIVAALTPEPDEDEPEELDPDRLREDRDERRRLEQEFSDVN